MQDYPYDCPACGATGERPLVVGECLCPECGGHLWIVRPVSAGSGAVLAPAAYVPILPARPPLRPRYGRLGRLAVSLLRPFFMVWLVFRQSMLERRVNDLLDRLGDHPGRETVDQVLGEPLYAVSGDACEDMPNPPDLIECYETEGCCVDLWFKDDELVDISGFVKPTSSELILAGVKS